MIIGIRREDKNRWERRVPLTPEDVGRLISEHGLQFHVQPSTTPPVRIFADQAYADAGAEVREDLSGCDLVVGVKEMPLDFFRERQAYMFFSHTLKCQPFNMPMLKKMLDLGCTLFDYELISDNKDRRLVFFGRYAGLAGMIDSLSALGRRLEEEGIPNPFIAIKMAHEYGNLTEAKASVLEVGGKINAIGIDERITPLIVGFSGYGNVSEGAQEILDLMPVRTITPDELPWLRDGGNISRQHIYKVIFKEEHMVVPKASGAAFDLQHYYKSPEDYVPVFDRYTPHINVLINAIFWTDKYPRLVTIDFLRDLFSLEKQPHLRVIGDISCDVDGSIECTVKATESDAPCYVFEPATGAVREGYAGAGPVIMAIDNLPCELPVESSEHFSASLRDFIAEFSNVALRSPGGLLDLSDPLKKSIIAYQGELLSPFMYLEECIQKETSP